MSDEHAELVAAIDKELAKWHADYPHTDILARCREALSAQPAEPKIQWIVCARCGADVRDIAAPPAAEPKWRPIPKRGEPVELTSGPLQPLAAEPKEEQVERPMNDWQGIMGELDIINRQRELIATLTAENERLCAKVTTDAATYLEMSDALTAERDQLSRDYQRIIREVLACDPHPASSRPDDDQLEPPWEVIARVWAERDRAVEALRELIARKDLKGRIKKMRADGVPLLGWQNPQMQELKLMEEDYERRQPLAWSAARAVLAASPTEDKTA